VHPCEILGLAGLRVTELCELDVQHIHLTARKIHVRESKTDAGVRGIDIRPRLLEELKAYRAAHDQTDRRRSTFQNAFPRLKLFTGRQDPAGREEQFERLYLLLLDANPFTPRIDCYHVADPSFPVDIDEAFTDLVNLVGERNFDLYEAADGGIHKI